MMLASWRFAARLARRDVRRRPGRTFLVMLLIALPIAAMTIGSVIAHTTSDSTDERFTRRFGAASDYAFQGQLSDFDATKLPRGSRIVISRSYSFGIRFGRGRPSRYVDVHDVDLSSPLTASIVLLRQGRIPRTPGEILLSESLSKTWKLRVGDTLMLPPKVSTRIVGIGVEAAYWRNNAIIAPGFHQLVKGEQLANAQDGNTGFVHIDVPGRPTQQQAEKFVRSTNANNRISRFAIDRGTQIAPKAIAWGWVAGTLLLAIIGIIVAAAFATSARRQLVTLGQLGANGASPRLLRRTMALQGMWNGIVGVVAGMTLAGLILAIGRNRLETLINHDPGAYDIRVVEMLIIAITGTFAATVAAWLPARGAARVSVLSALAGHRPTKRVPRIMVPIGFTTFGIGIVVLALAAAASRSGGSDALALASVFGGISILVGACCISPAVVSVLDRVSAKLGGAARVAARSLGRARARSAAIVTALSVASAVAIAAGTTVASAYDDHARVLYFPRNAISIEGDVHTYTKDDLLYKSAATPGEPDPNVRHFVDNPVPTFAPPTQSLRDRINDVVPGLRFSPIMVATWDPAPFDPNIPPQLQDRFSESVYNSAQQGWLYLATPRLLDLMKVGPTDRDKLNEVGAIAYSYELFNPEQFNVKNQSSPQPTTIDTPPQAIHHLKIAVTNHDGVQAHDTAVDFIYAEATDPGAFPWLRQRTLITADAARRSGFAIAKRGEFAVAPKRFTESQQVAMSALQQDLSLESQINQAQPKVGDVATFVNLQFESEHSQQLTRNQVLAIIGGAALLMVLLIVAIALSLAAAEGRDERDVLVAIGARPPTMRKVAAYKAAVLTVGGALLAIPIGFLPIAAVLSAGHSLNTRTKQLRFPWQLTVGLVIVIPLIASFVAWVGSWIAQTARPTKMSTLSND